MTLVPLLSHGFSKSVGASKGYHPPFSKQGVTDVREGDSFNQRLRLYSLMGISVAKHDVMWYNWENTGLKSSLQPLNCPTGSTMYPKSEAERKTLGFFKFRCLSNIWIQIFDVLLAQEAKNGVQSLFVVWGSPAMYRDPGCVGIKFAGNQLFEGCAPSPSSMDDLEDMYNFLASRYNGGSLGKGSHYVVWNENASATWFNLSPFIPTSGSLGAGQKAYWIDRYADMMRRVHRAVSRHASGALIYAGTDVFWSPPSDQSIAHIGSKTLIDGLWDRLGTSIDWSVSVHPYGDTNAAPPSGQYNYTNLSLVFENQAQHLRTRGFVDVFNYPQSYLIASEQGWPQRLGANVVADHICRAYDISLKSPFLLGSTHNYFHSNEPQETSKAVSVQGEYFGIIPFRIKGDLSDIGSIATGQAYQSTSPAQWGLNNEHYCCRSLKLGCVGAPVHASVFDVSFYKKLYKDLAGLSDVQALSHWVQRGIDEGRRASPGFAVQDYIQASYRDFPASGINTYRKALIHYLQFGWHEPRLTSFATHPLIFNFNDYMKFNSDLPKSWTPEQAMIHWLQIGLKEGRRASQEFNAKSYLNKNEDVAKVFGSQNYISAAKHYLIFGKSEGRSGR